MEFHNQITSNAVFNKHIFLSLTSIQSEVEDDLDQHERKRLKRVKAMSDSEEEEEGSFFAILVQLQTRKYNTHLSNCILDDEEKIQEAMKDLIDDRPIEESDSSDGESDASGPTGKRKKSDDDSELDDRLEDEDYELIEENLGVKVERVSAVEQMLRRSEISLCNIFSF